MSTDLATRLQEDAAARLGADPYATDLPILLVRRGVTDAKVKEAVGTRSIKNGKQGAAIIVLMPSRKVTAADSPAPTYDWELTVRALTLPKLNDAAGGTKKSAEEISLWIDRLLHHCGIGPTTLNAIGAEPWVGEGEAAGSVGYDCTFGITQGQDPGLKARTPSITAPGDGTATITCGTGGATIHYTTDGSYPGPTALVAPAFPTAITGLGPVLLRAVAYAAGHQASNLAEKDLSTSS